MPSTNNVTPDEEPKTYLGALKEQINLEPDRQPDMAYRSSMDDVSAFSDGASGYRRETNECTEFCIDCFLCFGTFDECCPSSGEGCLTTAATFVGNILFGCCKNIR